MQLCTLAILGLVTGERTLGSFILLYNGDRITQPRPRLTSLGAQQCLESGEFYRNRYFHEFPIPGLDQVYDPDQFSVMLPVSDVHYDSMRAWTQGFYPKLTPDQIDDVEEARFTNGTQYVQFDSIAQDSSRYWMVKGDYECYRSWRAKQLFMKSSVMNETSASTYSFYQSLVQYTTEIPKDNLTFVNAQTIYDHFLIQSTHNESFRKSIGGLDGEVFQQVKILQDIYSVNYNTWNNSLVSGRRLLSEATTVLWEALHASGPAQHSMRVMAASSDQFYQIFKLLDLLSSNESRFTGIVNYAATLVIELFTRDGSDERFVRVGIRNGTTVNEGNVTLDFVPVFNNTENYMNYDRFNDMLVRRSKIDTLRDWCRECWNTKAHVICENFILHQRNEDLKYKYYHSMSLAGAGAIGACIITGVFLLIWSLVCCCARRRKSVDAETEALTAVPSPQESKALTVDPPPSYKSKRVG